jgi:hypothetical protein
VTQATGTIGPALARLAAATAGLLADLDGLGEAEARGASRLPGWTRGHVLTHLARNAEGSTRLLAWLLGRGDGSGLTRPDPGPGPPVPSVYMT